MVRVGRVRMLVGERRVVMGVRVRLPRRVVGAVRVPVVFVVDVRVGVVERVVRVPVPVALAQQERDPSGHHRHREPVGPPEALAREDSRGQRAEAKYAASHAATTSCSA